MHPGLCAACVNARQIRSQRGSTFWLCELSRTDPSFPRYPRLPVVACPGFAAQPIFQDQPPEEPADE